MPKSKKSPMQRLKETSDLFEIWWDSSPLVFDPWTQDMIEKVDEEKKELLKQQLKVLFDTGDPASCLFDGVTTNPKLTSAAIGILEDKTLELEVTLLELTKNVKKVKKGLVVTETPIVASA